MHERRMMKGFEACFLGSLYENWMIEACAAGLDLQVGAVRFGFFDKSFRGSTKSFCRIRVGCLDLTSTCSNSFWV